MKVQPVEEVVLVNANWTVEKNVAAQKPNGKTPSLDRKVNGHSKVENGMKNTALKASTKGKANFESKTCEEKSKG